MMKRCPRCHTTMIVGMGDAHEDYAPLWKCLSCGQEIYRDLARQAMDERLKQTIETTGPRRFAI